MNELDAFAPVSTDGLGPPETIIIPVIGIIVVLLIGKFGRRFIKLLVRISGRIGSVLALSIDKQALSDFSIMDKGSYTRNDFQSTMDEHEIGTHDLL